MRLVIFFISLIISAPAFSRQYFQCNILELNRTDVMVVNLQTSKEGTIFLSSGMQNDESERFKAELKFEKIEKKLMIYRVHDENFQGHVAIPEEIIGKDTSSIDLEVNLNGYESVFSCFSKIYDEN